MVDPDASTRATGEAGVAGDPACWIDRVHDCCGTLVGEPHRRECAAADQSEQTSEEPS